MSDPRPIHLIVQYYRCADAARQAEIDTCLRENLLNPLIDAVHLLTEEEFDLSGFSNPAKVRQMVVGERLTYERAFMYANAWPEPGIWMLANADIYFDESLNCLIDADTTGLVYALSRHEVLSDGSTHIMDAAFAHGSQDAWIFTPPLDLQKMNSAVALGIPGCDQRIAHEFVSAGYVVLNPSLTIHSLHLDLTRDYDTDERVKRYMEVTNEEGFRAGLAAAPPHQLFLYPTDKLNVTLYDLFTMKLAISKAADIRAEALHHTVGELKRQIAEQIAGNERRIADKDRQIDDKDRQIADKDRQIADKDRQITDIFNSQSWKITAPLRRFADLIK